MLSLKFWKQDLKSSLVVFLVALPLCLGIALASNAPLASGLYAGIIGGIVVGALSGSPISVSGPAAGLTVIVLSAISTLGSFETFTAAVFLSGCFQILFGILRGGTIGDYFPTSVIKGMLVAIGIILILKQIPHAVGYDVDFMGDEAFEQSDGENTFTELLMAFNRFHPGAVLIGALSLITLVVWDKISLKGNRFFKLVPGGLVVVILGIGLNEVFKLGLADFIVEPKHLVQLPFDGGFRDFFSGMKMPNWEALGSLTVYKVALTIAIVGSLESLLSVDAADKMESDGRVTSKNRELFAQGTANALSGLVGGLPITAVIVRTTANVTAGAKTNLSALLHGVWLLVCVVAIPNILNLIPLSSLAAILLLVGYKLAKPSIFQGMWKKGANQFIPFFSTILAILFTDLLIGIVVGIIIGFIFVIRSNMHKSMVMVRDGNSFLIRFYKDVSFLHKSAFIKMLDEIPDNSDVIIDGSHSVFVDNDIIDLIEDFMRGAEFRNINIVIKRSTLALSGFFKEEING